MRNAKPKVSEPAAKPTAPEPEATSSDAVAAYRAIDVLWPKTPARQIIREVARAHGLTFEEVVGEGLKKKLVEARFDAIKAVADGRPDLSLPQIGYIFNRDHPAIIHALKKRGGRKNREGWNDGK
ncbi:helix-turn-helix domain-containing protein [Mesorhizobium amorphae]